MEENSLTVLLIEDDPQYAQLVQHWLANVAGNARFVLNWTDSLADGIVRLKQGGVDVILLDLGLPDCSGMDTFLRARSRSPNTPIVVLSSADSESLALQMIQQGAEDYLVKSSCDAATLARVVRRAVVRHKSQEVPHSSTSPSRVISVVGAKGGSGTTMIACTLAAELRLQTAEKVLLADLDPTGGLVSFFTGLECQYSLRDAVNNLPRLDETCWKFMAVQHADGFDVIASPHPEEEIAEASVRKVLSFAKSLYTWSVMDLGRLSQKAIRLLEPDHEVFVVTNSTIPALFAAKRAIETLRVSALDGDRIRLIVNHMGEKPLVSGNALNNMFGVPVYATVPSATAELYDACVQKRLPAVNGNFRKAIVQLARKMAYLPEQRKSSLTSLVSFARFRKAPEAVHASSGNG